MPSVSLIIAVVKDQETGVFTAYGIFRNGEARVEGRGLVLEEAQENMIAEARKYLNSKKPQ